MEQDDITKRLWEIARRFNIPDPIGLLANRPPPFDISQQNIHNSKAEFNAELEAARNASDQVWQLVQLFSAPYRDDDGLKDMAIVLCDALDKNARIATRALVLETANDVVRKTSNETSLSFNLTFALLDMHKALSSRLQELGEQETAYWTLKGRAPNHHARTIALRFAKLVARHTGTRPTVGVSREGNYPSTDFGRALEEIFEILGIDAAFRRHANWAVKQLTEEDLEREPVNVLNSLLPMGSTFGTPRNVLDEIAETLAKGDAP